MTVVVWRDGTLAADSASWAGGVMITADAEKVVRLPDGSLMAGAGNTADLDLLKEWIANGRDKTAFPELKEKEETCVMLAAPGGVFLFHGDKGVTRCDDEPEGSVIGCETAFIRGLLAAGKSAEECVQIAIERVAYVGGHVVSMKLEPPTDGLMVDEAPAKPENWRDGYGLGDAA